MDLKNGVWPDADLAASLPKMRDHLGSYWLRFIRLSRRVMGSTTAVLAMMDLRSLYPTPASLQRTRKYRQSPARETSAADGRAVN